MAYNTVSSLFKAIADAIRSKDGSTDKIARQDIPSKIMAISTAPEKVVITSADYLFSGQIPEALYSFIKIDKPTLMNHMYFMNDKILDVDMTKLDFTPNPNPVACNNMFYLCDLTNSVKLASGIKAKSVAAMFQGCAKLTSIDLNGLDVSECTDFRSFLNGCRLITEFDGSVFPNLSVTNNNAQLFFSTNTSLRKVWIPKEWKTPNTTAGYSPFVSNGGSNAMNPNLHIFTDAISEADQIANKRWTNLTMVYNSSGTKIPTAQIHYGSTHADYEAY